MKTFLALLFVLSSQAAHAAEGAAYLKSPEGVRSSALGGAFTAAQGSAESLWYNPAGLSRLRGAEASFSHLSLLGGYDTDHLVGAAYLGWQHSLGLLYSRKGASDTRRDAQANPLGNFEVSSSILGAGYAYEFADFSLGLSGKLLQENVDTLSGSSFVYDAGIQGNFSRDRVYWGASLQNMGPAPALGNPGVEFKAPGAVRLGAGVNMGQPAQALLLLGDYSYFLDSQRMDVALGAEYSEVFQDNSLALRLGYNFGQSALGGWSGFSAGASLGFSWLGIDYAFQPLDVLGGTHRVALTLTYDQKAEAEEQSMAEFLGINPNARVLPTPTFTPTPIRAKSELKVGAELDALLAPSPTPTPTMTPWVQEKKEEARGVLGALRNLFGWGKKKSEEKVEAEPEKKERPGGILKKFFSIFGVEDEEAPVEAPDDPSAPKEDEDSAIVAPQGGATPGVPAGPDATPGAKPEGLGKKLKRWFSF